MAIEDWTLPQDGDDFTAYPYQRKFTLGLEERACATGNSFVWFRINAAWTTGTISGMTATTVTDSTRGGNDWVKTVGDCVGPRWTGWECEDSPFQVADYDVVLNASSRDETKIIVMSIQSNDETTLTIPSIQNWVTAGYFPSVGWFVGKDYAIINSGGLWWHDRIPAFPNDSDHYNGSGASVTVLTTSGLSGNLVGKSFVWSGGSLSAPIIENSSTLVTIARQATAPSASYEIKDGETVLFSGSISASHDGVRMEDAPFVTDVSGKEILIYAGSVLKRITIASNTLTTILFTRQTDEVGGTFVVVDVGDRGFPGKEGGQPFLHYGGAMESFYTVFPGDDFTDTEAVSTAPKPIATKVWNEPNGDTNECEPVTHNAFGIDLWSETDEDCPPPDFCYSPDFFKTYHGWQTAIQNLSAAFVEPGIDYTGRKEIHGFSLAQHFRFCSINNFEASATATLTEDESASTVTFTFSVPYDGVGLYYDVTDAAGDVRYAAGGPVGTSGSLTLTFGPETAGTSMNLTGSWGWTQVVERRFLNPYGRTAWIPDIDPGDGLTTPPSVIDPPEVKDFCCEDEEEPPEECCRDCIGVGQWIHRNASTTYAELDSTQNIIDGGTAFVEGELARFEGQGWDGPGIYPPTKVEGSELDIGYWRNFSVQRMRPDQHRLYVESKRGKATDGGTWFLRDETKNWWAYPFGTGAMKTHALTATSGSGSSFTDASIADEENEVRCFFAADRFVGFSAAFNGFTFEIDSEDEYGAPLVLKVPVLSANQSGVVTFPSYCGVTVSAAMTGRIKEPHCNLNWWQGRTLVVTKPDGTKLTAAVVGNDADTLFFAPLAEAIQPDWDYEIEELTVGGVYKRSSGEWVLPTGTDSRGGGTTFHANPTENAPTQVVRYGLACLGQVWTTQNMQEIFKMIDAMRWTFYQAVAWTSRQDPETEELNTWQPTQQLFDIGCYNIGGDGSDYDWTGLPEDPNYPNGGLLYCYSNVTESESDGAAPYWYCGGTLFPTSSYIGGGAAYAYGVLTGIPTCLARAVDFYAMGWINASNPDERDDITRGCYHRNEPWNLMFHTGERNVHDKLQFDSTSTGLNFRTFKKYSTVGPNQDERVVSDRLGSNAPVAPVDKPMAFFNELRDADEMDEEIRECLELESIPEPCDGGPSNLCGHEYNEWEQKGFGSYAANNTAIARWDVSGGFTYVT